MYGIGLLVLLIAAFCTTQRVVADPLPITEPESVEMSSEELARTVLAMEQMVQKQKIAGAVTVVARHGKIVLFEAVGDRDINSDNPMSLDTIVRIYSMSKPVTSVAVMMLVEDGKLDLDDPVGQYLPELKSLPVFVKTDGDQLQLEEASREITVRDLLRHTSGLTYGFFGDSEIDRRYLSADILSPESSLTDLITKLAKLPLLHQPGTRFEYSVSTDVLGRLVEVVSGESLDEFFQQRIFNPLKMTDTGFAVPPEKLDRFATNYSPNPAGGLIAIDRPATSDFRRPPSLLSGGAGLVSTAGDYIRFCQMLLNGGQLDDVRLLDEATVQMMTRNQLPQAAYPLQLNGPRPGVGFGFGFSVIVESTDDTQSARVGEYGWGGAASTHFWISPQDDLAVVVLTQLMPFSFQMEDLIKPIVYDAIVP